MRFLADEGVERQIVAALRVLGHDVAHVAEMSPGASDNTVMEMASSNGAILLTTDKDFGEQTFRQQKSPSGVVLLRLAGLPNRRKAEITTEAIRDHEDELPAAFTVVRPGRIRIRSIPVD